jgi:hypothetical protein
MQICVQIVKLEEVFAAVGIAINLFKTNTFHIPKTPPGQNTFNTFFNATKYLTGCHFIKINSLSLYQIMLRL